MGLSSLPAPSEGMLCIILVNTAISISIFKGLIRSVLHVIGIHLPPPDSIEAPSEPSSFEYRVPPSEASIDEIRRRIPATAFGSICNCSWSEPDCPVCLTRFKPESEVSNLRCGHVFHKVCLEKWLDYWNFTCPLCRTPLTPEEEVPWI